MLSEEEKKAIQMIKNQKENVDECLIAMENPENYIGEDVEKEYLEWQKNAEIILNLIENQQKELDKKDKIIDLMAEKICFFDIDLLASFDNEIQCVEYFTKKVEEKDG